MTTLRYEQTASHIYDKLKNIPRTGWVMRGVKNPETVYDHTVELVSLASTIANEMQLSVSETDDLEHIVEIHDWAEAITGDLFLQNTDQTQYQTNKLNKAREELAAMKLLLENQLYKTEVMAMFNRYEASSDEIAKIAKELDKYQSLEQALYYEQTQKIPLFDEFLDYYKRDWPFFSKVIIDRINQLEVAHRSNKI